MRARQVISRAIGICLAVCVFAPDWASARPAGVNVAYTAPGECPSGAQFAASVAARGRTVAITDDDSRAPIRVSIAEDPRGGYRGSLRVRPAAEGVREVRGVTCREVVDALAVVAVSTLGPAVASSDPPSPNPETPAAPPATPDERPPPLAPTPAAATGPQRGNIGAAPDMVTVGPGTLRFDRDYAMSVFGGVMTGILPGVVIPRFDFEVARTNMVTSPDGQSFRVVPTVRLHTSLFPYGDSYHSAYGTTTASGGAFGADLCAPFYYDRGGLQILVCAEFMAGYFGVQTTSPEGSQGPVKIMGFAASGLGLDLAYNIGRHFHVGLKVGGALVGNGGVTAEATNGSQIFKSSPFGMHVMFGLGGNF